jgi:hypothetical protein
MKIHDLDAFSASSIVTFSDATLQFYCLQFLLFRLNKKVEVAPFMNAAALNFSKLHI